MGGRTCTRSAAPASVPGDGRRARGGGNGRDPTNDGSSRGRGASRPQARVLWTGEALFLLMMAIFTAVVIMATAQRSPVTTGTLLRGIAAGLPIGIAVFVFFPLGVVRYQASRVLPAVPQGALEALAWTVVLVAPAVRRACTSRRVLSSAQLASVA